MKKIAIFAEGQTELIFIRWLLLRLIDNSKLSFECRELLAHNESPAPYKYSALDPQVYFRIIDVHGDEGVLSSIHERESSLLRAGYDEIIAVRDMYSETYLNLSPKRMSDTVTRKIIDAHHETIRQMTHRDRIKLYFAIMEIEAWFLGMYNIFKKIDPLLTTSFIGQKLKIDLANVDPQESFFKPSDQVEAIYALCGRAYGKRKQEIEGICSKMDIADFNDARENGRCSTFEEFYRAIAKYC